ncbi:delta-class carbonic anhydrase [Glaciecola sp. 1036]|uniref:delta-class carbonic anhydrase n=1 Tax=Alteromonadaceae TaxID=72275 RepID=UPI003D07464A
MIKKISCLSAIASITISMSIYAEEKTVSNSVIAQQKSALAQNTKGKGFGPQSPRDIDQTYGTNEREFSLAPNRSELNLCNIHFHKGAEHKGGDFTTYAGNGDGQGKNSGYLYNHPLSKAEQSKYTGKVCPAKGKSLEVGDTLEVHYVFSSAQISPGPTLGACLSDSTMNPQLRVEAQVIVLTNDGNGRDFEDMTEIEVIQGYYQAPNIPSNTGIPVQYLGSTTGPSYNEKGSPLQVSWSVRPQVTKVDISSVAEWCEDNEFNEDHAHGVRNLVTNPMLLSPIQ